MGASSSTTEDAANTHNGTTDVTLHVYKPSPTVSDLNVPGFGIYHTGVQVHGTEYVFAGHDAQTTGVYTQRPKSAGPTSSWVYFKSEHIGKTNLTSMEVRVAISELKREFTGDSYDLVTRNCNHFSDALCQRLTGKGIPSWVNRAANLGGIAKKFINVDTSLKGQQAAREAKLNSQPDIEYVDLYQHIHVAQASCLNEHDDHTLHSILPKNGPVKGPGKASAYLESESDEQLLLLIPFKKPVRLTSIVLGAAAGGTAPTKLSLFTNERNIDFTDVEQRRPAQTLELSWPSGDAGKLAEQTVPLQTVKFQNVSFLVIFISGNEANDEVTIAQFHWPGQVALRLTQPGAASAVSHVPMARSHVGVYGCTRVREVPEVHRGQRDP